MNFTNLKRNLKWLKNIILVYIIVNILYLIMPRSVKIFFHIERPDQIDTTYITYKTPADFSRILNLQQVSSTSSPFLLIKTTISKFRNPISSFIYKNQYYLQVYKLTDHFDSPLANNIIEKSITSSVSYNSYYNLAADNNIQYLYLDYLPKKPRKIFLDLYGKDTQKIVQNDSLLAYYSAMRNFSIKYDKEKTFDICGHSKEELFTAKYEPFEILFYKDANSNLFLLMMSTYGKNTHYLPGTINNLIHPDKN